MYQYSILKLSFINIKLHPKTFNIKLNRIIIDKERVDLLFMQDI